MRGWFESTFGTGALAAQFVVALIVVIVLFGIIAAFARRRNRNSGPPQMRGRQPRLAVMDMADVDDRRKLLLIRRDNVEHLVMIGGPSDLVVESAIMRNRPAPHAADRATAGLAMQTHTRAQARAPSALPVGPGTGSADRSGDTRVTPPVRGRKIANPDQTPEAEQAEKKPDLAANAGRPAPTAAPVPSAPTPASSQAAVAGLAAGAAALTAAAASVKRRESEPETPAEKPAKEPPVLPPGLNGSGDTTTLAPTNAADIAMPEPVTPEPAIGEDAAKDAKEPDAEKVVESTTKPFTAADVTKETTPTADAEPGTDAGAAAESGQKAADETPVDESVTDSKLAPDESAGTTSETSPDESPPKEAAVADTVDAAEAADDFAAALDEAMAPQQDRPGESSDTSAEVTEPKAEKPVEAAPESREAPSDVTTEPEIEAPPAAAGLPPAKSFDEIFAKNAGDDDTGIAPAPEDDVPAAAEAETAAAAGDGEAELADKTTEPADKTTKPAAEQLAAVSPFPTIPEDVRRSVIDAAQRAGQLPGAGSGSAVQADMADGGEKTTLGDLAERLEQALAEQASTLSGQIKPAAGAKPGADAAPPDLGSPDPDQDPDATVKAWESGELAAAPQAAGAAPQATASADEAPEEPQRQSQAVLEGETDSGVIDFSDRKKTSPEGTSSESLEDEMARLLGELTGRTSGR